MKIKIVKKDNGHDVFLNGEWIMWVIGSRRNAQKELDKDLKRN